jgi:hypothetical protein
MPYCDTATTDNAAPKNYRGFYINANNECNPHMSTLFDQKNRLKQVYGATALACAKYDDLK